MNKLISIDIRADFGLLKKPDTNEPVYLTFNMIHKPALLGIFGAIIGLPGFKRQGELPEYYKKLQDLKVGIKPLNHEKGNYKKTVVTYNNTTGMASFEEGGNLIVSEQTLIAPAFKVFVMIDMENENQKKLYSYLKGHEAEYLPYLGKNDFSLWWNEFKEHDCVSFSASDTFTIGSIFIKSEKLSGKTENQDPFQLMLNETGSFMYFENLPIEYLDKPMYQYKYCPFAFTDYQLKQNYKVKHLYQIENGEKIQIF